MVGKRSFVSVRPASCRAQFMRSAEILAVVDGELRVKAESRRVFAQEPRGDGVERAGIGGRGGGGSFGRQAAGEEPLDPPAKLRRGAAGEGREHDALRIRAGEDERRHPMGEHRGLAGARAGDDEQRPRTLGLADPVLDREPLLGVDFDDRRRANQGKRHGATQPCFALCSQGPRASFI